jgi:predicted  nucleic acid-binding Zn-ribbon protein
MSTDAGLLSLLSLQEHDLALDRLQHRHNTLPERESLARAATAVDALVAEIAVLTVQRDELAREEQRLDDEARSLAARATAVDKKMYSGEISSPKELQAMQADIDQLKRHQQSLENTELELMEQREPLDARLADLETRRARLETEVGDVRRVLSASEREIAGEAAVEQAARDGIAVALDRALLADYERCRARARGAGAARLVGNTCQGCHLTIPTTEVAAIKRAPEGTIAHCDNCGCILVP